MGPNKLSLVEESSETHELRAILNDEINDIFDLGSGCLVWLTKEPEEITLFYDPSRVIVEFFEGGGSTDYDLRDTEHILRMVVDSDFSKAQMKRAHRSPYMSGRYALEWHGKSEPMEVPFPTYMDDMCVSVGIKTDGSVVLRSGGSIVPQLERVANIADIAFVGSTLKTSDDQRLVAFLSGMVDADSLTGLVDRMSGAYALRSERGKEVPYKSLNLFSNQ